MIFAKDRFEDLLDSRKSENENEGVVGWGLAPDEISGFLVGLVLSNKIEDGRSVPVVDVLVSIGYRTDDTIIREGVSDVRVGVTPDNEAVLIEVPEGTFRPLLGTVARLSLQNEVIVLNPSAQMPDLIPPTEPQIKE